MNYLLKSSNRSRHRYALPIAIAAFIFVVFIVHLLAPRFFEGFFTKIASPFWKTKNATEESLSNALLSRSDLIKKNEELQATIDELKNSQLSSSLIAQENEELKALLNRPTKNDAVLAIVLQKPPISFYDTLIVDVGTAEQIKIGDKVFAAGNIVIGEVAEVDGSTSKIKLYSTAGEKYDVRIGNDITAAATGRGGGSFEAVVPRDVVVAPGDPVTIPRLSPTVFGIVSAIVIDPARPFKTVLFQNPINIFELSRVVIIRS